MEFSLVKVEVYVPREYVEVIRDELNKIGACKVGNYDHVISFHNTEGYWRPLEGSNAYDGEIGKISKGMECKLEVRCTFDLVNDAVDVIRKNHPYEEPVINILPLLNEMFDVK